MVELGVWVHDIANWKFHDGDDTAGPREAAYLLVEEGGTKEIIKEIVDIVAAVSFKGTGVRTGFCA